MARVMILNESGGAIRLRTPIKLWIISMIFLWMSGCGRSAIKMGETEQADLQIQEVIEALHYPTDKLRVTTPDGSIGLGGGTGSSDAATSEGKEMIEEYGLEDPSGRVKERFVSGLKANAKVADIQSTEAPLSFEEPDEMKRIFTKGMVLDFKTNRWELSSSKNIRGADLIYSARARLIRLEDSKILWQGVCGVTASEAKGRSNGDEMIIDAGDVLRIKMDEAAERCAKSLLAQFLGKTENQMIN